MSEKLLNKDLENIELLEGETPKDINEKCFHLCAQYLGGIWSQISTNNFKVERISGGLSNMMFHCTASVEDELFEVAIRLYGEKPLTHGFDVDLNRHNDGVISLVLSERGLAPKLFGSFPGGQILQFIKHRQFRIEDQNNENLVLELSRKLARLHSIKVPINRNVDWVFQTIDRNVFNGYQKFPIDKMIDEFNLTTFKANNLNKELEWVRHTIKEIDSPICLSHNDFRGNNILISEAIDLNSNSSECIVFCDFEVSGYGYRGSDFGTLFAEWNRKDRTYQEIQKFPDDSTIKTFIDEYIRESILIYGKQYMSDERNTFEHILKEVKLFTLVSYIFMLTSCLAIEDYKQMGINKKLLMFGADIHFKNYIHLKNTFIEQKIFY